MISVGDKLPDVTLMLATPEGPQKTTTAELFGGKKTVLFAVPGAFTPTCSASHLPGFVEKESELKAKGADQIVCTSVNDAFVMKAWGDSANAAGKITMLADGNAEFAEAVGLSMDGTGYGMGKRSQRYAMIVEDGTVTSLDVEEGGAFDVSSAETQLGRL